MRNWYRHGRPLRAAIGTCCLAAFLFFGFDQGVFSGILQNENWLSQFHHPVSHNSRRFLDPLWWFGPTLNIMATERHQDRYSRELLLPRCPMWMWPELLHRRLFRSPQNDVARHVVRHCRRQPTVLRIHRPASCHRPNHHGLWHRHRLVHRTHVPV